MLFFMGASDIEFHVQDPCSILARKGTAGSRPAWVCSGHEFGGQGATERSACGQHGSSCHAYRTAVMEEELRLPSGSAASAMLKSGSRLCVVVFQPQGASARPKHLATRKSKQEVTCQ